MLFHRETGLLLHPTSLPGPWGIGTLGVEAEDLVRTMAGSGVSVWQVLPLSPPGFSASPYQALSSWALNPLLLSPDKLLEKGLLTAAEASVMLLPNGPSVDWNLLAGRQEVLERAAQRSLDSSPMGFNEFLDREEVLQWATFAAKKELNLGKPWHLWKNMAPPPKKRILIHAMVQFLLEEQWLHLRELCNSSGIRILGDLPIYTAHDSADVFYNRSLFRLLPDGRSAFLAGVPPDYFSRTGQLWGNPVYDWRESRKTGHQWWIDRLKRSLDLFDMVRIDHFRGFESYWEVPAKAKTAVCGHWRRGPGREFFDMIRSRLGRLPLVAEDLGMITPEVEELRKYCGFPGMTVLQFAFQDPEFSPENISRDTVVYTGTHDNDTSRGWIRTTGRRLGFESVEQLISVALASPAELAVIPVQDVLELGSEARMNTPATSTGNWSFRMVEPLKRIDRLGRG